MDIALNHCFADHDARLDDVLETLRRQRRLASGRGARNLADRAVKQVVTYREFDLSHMMTAEDALKRAFEADPYEQLMRAFKRAQLRLNPILDAVEAARHAAGERRVVRHFLETHVARITSKSALLIWVMARTAWRKLLARVASKVPIRRANGFFGADKVDGRNIP